MAKTDNIQFVGSLSALEEVSKHKGVRIVLGGDLVLFSLTMLTDSKLLSDYVRQPDRKTAGGLSKEKLYVWVSGRALSTIAKHKLKASLLIDYYLTWGLARKEREFMLIGGVPGQDELLISNLYFKKRKLVKVTEKTLARQDDAKLASEVVPLLEKLRAEHPDVPIHWGFPLVELAETGPNTPSEDIFNRVHGPHLNLGLPPSILTRFVLPIGLVLLGVVGYVSAIGVPYYKYLTAANVYEQESAMFKGELQYASDRLRLLQERKIVLSGSSTALVKLEHGQSLSSMLGKQGAKVSELQLRFDTTNPSGNGPPLSDVEVRVEVSKDANLTAIQQAEAIGGAIVASKGYQLRLLPLENTESNGSATRRLKFGGDFNAAK